MKLLKKLKNYSFMDICYLISKRLYERYRMKRLFTNKYEFIDRSCKRKNLLLIVAGYQPYYWDIVLERVKRNQQQFTEPLDVCVCVPGADGTVLKEMCAYYEWSYLKIKEDRLSLAQNIAIKLHGDAEWIYKIDEDIILSDFYFEKMKKAYLSAPDFSNLEVGFVAPLINVNAYGATPFLKTIGKYDAFVEQFGPLVVGLQKPIHLSEEVGRWIWEQSVPFDQIAADIADKNADKISVCPHRFSIGAILFKRDLWRDMGAFVVDMDLAMGIEESQICEYCMNNMLGIYIAEDVFVGHLGFQRQKEAIHQFFEDHIEQFKNTVDE